MQEGITPKSRRAGFDATDLERRGLNLETGAPVTGAVATDEAVAVGFGDGTLRFFWPDLTSNIVRAHNGVILCMESYRKDCLTGGDDGRFLKISHDGDVQEIANFQKKWVDCVAVSGKYIACSSGRNVYIWSIKKSESTEIFVEQGMFEHASTVGGLAFDPSGNCLAVTQYGGVVLWKRKESKWISSKLEWKGFHGPVTFSPNGKFVVTAMQERALHGWILPDKGHFQMAGYPVKIKSFTWVGDTPYLATSGADEAICWPFDGEHGPTGRASINVGRNRNQVSTFVLALEGEQAVFIGFRDGAVLLTEIDENKEPIPIKGSTGVEITALSVSASGSHLFIGDAKGNILWVDLWAKNVDEKSIKVQT